MKRLLWAVAGVACLVGFGGKGVTGAGAAEPPAGGKERTLLEQEFLEAERTTPTATGRGMTRTAATPVTFASTVRFVRVWVLESAGGRLDVTRGGRQVW
jgi:hypothetical protein